MANLSATRPRVSRETRLLLLTAVGAIVALWGLARLRFPERDVSPNPVPAVLAPLTAPAGFDELALAIAQLDARVADTVVVVDDDAAAAVAALRLRDGIALLVRPAPAGAFVSTSAGPAAVVGQDGASGLTVVRLPLAGAPVLERWSPRRLETPRYLLSSDIVGRRVTWRPVFVGGLVTERAPRWNGDIWIAPAQVNLAPGAVLFTINGAWAGVAAAHDGRLAIVPPDVVTANVDALLATGRPTPGVLGISVGPLTPAIAAASGAPRGVVVTWVDPTGPAMGVLGITDVIESADAVHVRSLDDWEARMARLAAGDVVLLSGYRRGEAFGAPVTAVPVPTRPVVAALGLGLRRDSGSGSAVIRVDPGSDAARAGIRVGDRVTVFDGLAAPTPPQVVGAYSGADSGRRLLVGIRRGETRLVLVVAKS